MKFFLILLIVFLAIIGCKKNESNNSKVEERNGIYYLIDQHDPYTGIIIENYKNGQVWSKRSFRDGKRHGEWAYYFENGQIDFKSNYIDGKEHGEIIYYFESGKVMSKRYFNNGKPDGEWLFYYENGQLKIKKIYKNGEVVESIQYFENGQVENISKY